MNTLSTTGEDLIESFEELRLTSYLDSKGVPTIGWGHTGPKIVLGMTCTRAQADAWLYEDCQVAALGVDSSLETNVTQNQFDALVSFAFNVGVSAEAHSTMMKLINARDFTGAAAEFPKWDHVDKIPNAGLLRRREAEQALFLL